MSDENHSDKPEKPYRKPGPGELSYVGRLINELREMGLERPLEPPTDETEEVGERTLYDSAVAAPKVGGSYVFPDGTLVTVESVSTRRVTYLRGKSQRKMARGDWRGRPANEHTGPHEGLTECQEDTPRPMPDQNGLQESDQHYGKPSPGERKRQGALIQELRDKGLERPYEEQEPMDQPEDAGERTRQSMAIGGGWARMKSRVTTIFLVGTLLIMAAFVYGGVYEVRGVSGSPVCYVVNRFTGKTWLVTPSDKTIIREAPAAKR